MDVMISAIQCASRVWCHVCVHFQVPLYRYGCISHELWRPVAIDFCDWHPDELYKKTNPAHLFLCPNQPFRDIARCHYSWPSQSIHYWPSCLGRPSFRAFKPMFPARLSAQSWQSLAPLFLLLDSAMYVVIDTHLAILAKGRPCSEVVWTTAWCSGPRFFRAQGVI